MDVGDVARRTREAGRGADTGNALDHAVRIGIISYGVVHLVIAWIALQLAFGDRAGNASTDGALHQMARTPVGGVLLYVVAAGLAALVLWQLAEAIAGHREEEGRARITQRLGSGLKAVLYGALGWSALSIAAGSGSGSGGSGSGGSGSRGSGGSETEAMTAQLMSMPFGQALVGLAGLAVLGYALRQIYRGLSEDFMKKLEDSGRIGDTGKAFVTLGKVGYVSKGIALMIVGGLVLWAAWTHDPDKSGGLDQALQTVLEQPFGAPMLMVLAAGIAAYGLFAFAWARHLDR